MSKEADIASLITQIDQLNKQAWDVRVNDSPKAFELSRESLEMARAISYPKGIAEAARSLGLCYLRLGKNDEAMPLLNEALVLFQSLNDLSGQAVIYEYMGVVHRNQGEFGIALDLLFNAISISQGEGNRENEAIHHYQVGVTYKYLGNFEKALDSLYTSISIHRENANRFYPSYPIHIIGSIYFENGDYAKALEYYREALDLRREFHDKLGEAGSQDSMGYTFFKLKDYPQAIGYCSQGLAISRTTGDKRSEANALQHLAEIYEQAGDTPQAILCSNDSMEIRKVTGDKRGVAEILLFKAGLPGQDRMLVQEWIRGALQIAEEIQSPDIQSRAHYGLYNYYQQEGQYKEAIEQLELHFGLEKELQKNSISQKILNLEISYKAEETRKEADAVKQRNKELTELNTAIQKQKQQLEKALVELQSAQAQLIQSEKMASLGELTAGIAHEIQNPLNFVNNFSEVSKELLDEMKTEIDSGNTEEAKEIAGDVIQNLEKILHHGKRADGIVKGMLQHSRSSTGVKEPVDINELADEYFRLAYHGFRARDRSFNVIMKNDYDETIGKVSIIPQDIGRAILNLITNAFYAVSEKKAGQPDGFEPTVTVSTRRKEDKVLISVKDNGDGIPPKVLDKIFQPFFTTKPTGLGTGLGLSLSYDIVKAHGGQLTVETKCSEALPAEALVQAGSEFIIQLPL